MKRLITGLFCIGLILFGFPKNISALTVTDILTESMSTWYNTNSTGTANASYFGPWVMEAIGDNLYLGYSASVPTHDNNGAHLGYFDGTNLQDIIDIDEQDVNQMAQYNSKLYVHGYDPDSNWDAGQIHIYDPSITTYTRKRYREASYVFVDAATTDANGIATFTGLKPTSYQVEVIKPASYSMTLESAGSEIDVDSAPRVETMCNGDDNPGPLFHDDAQTLNHIDFGLVSSAAAADAVHSGTRNEDYFTGNLTLEHYVWGDTNSDGIQDGGESGIAGVRVELWSRDPYLPCGIHMGGLWADQSTGYIYASVGHSVQNPNYPAYTGENNYVARSTDGGDEWEIITSNEYNSNGQYWAFTLAGQGGYLYKMHERNTFSQDETGDYTFKFGASLDYSSDGGSTWTAYTVADGTGTFTEDGFSTNDVISRPVHLYETLISFRNRIVMLHTDSSRIVTLQDGITENILDITGASFGDTFPAKDDPDYTANGGDAIMGSSQRYNSMAIGGANSDYLYVIGDDNKLYATTNLRNWNEVADFTVVGGGETMITVEYWPNKDWVVVATAGTNADLYAIDHADIVNEQLTQLTGSLSFSDGYIPEIDLKTIGSTGTQTTQIKTANGLRLSDVATTLSGATMDWSGATGESNAITGKSVVTGIVDLPGTAATHALYIPIPAGQEYNKVRICPNATSISELTDDCAGGEIFQADQTKTVGSDTVTVQKALDGTQWYFKATGVTGSGGFVYAKEGSNPAPQICSDPIGDSPPIITSVTQNTPTSVTVSFTDAPDPVEYYTVEYGTNPDDLAYSAIDIAKKNDQSFPVKFLLSNTTYHFRLRAQNGCTPGTWSDIYTHTPSGITTITPEESSPTSTIKPSPGPQPTKPAPKPSPIPITQTNTQTNAYETDKQFGYTRIIILFITPIIIAILLIYLVRRKTK